jgi:hypothetical protein
LLRAFIVCSLPAIPSSITILLKLSTVADSHRSLPPPCYRFCKLAPYS